AVERAAFEDDAGRLGLKGPSVLAAREDQLFAVVETPVGEGVYILRFLFERVEIEPLDERVELAVLFKDIKRVVVPAVFADEPGPLLRRRLRLGNGHALVRVFPAD